MNAAVARAISWTEQGLIPDAVTRRGIRQLLKQRLLEIHADDAEAAGALTEKFVANMKNAVIAPVPHLANEQHYEVPAEFFAKVLGPHCKYSCAYWPESVTTLEAAENTALQLTCTRARLADGMNILELGCGWGSLTLWMAEHYPHSHITAVSNSHSQRQYIMQEVTCRGLGNVHVITHDMSDFDITEQFDRVVSVEMFEHMRNWPVLLRRIHGWLKPDGLFFMHIFCHRAVPYAFEDNGPGDWMSRHFFSGGIMPSDDLPLRFQEHLKLIHRWRWNGQHYEKTANAWLENLDRQRDSVWPILVETYGAEAAQWWVRWRLFFMACAELFGYDHGQQWWVGHYLFKRPA
jgi:cyclopropane-fatty-acyl-phospholipid synthase